MTREEKQAVIEDLKGKFHDAEFFYITDSSTLTVGEVNELRGLCYESGVELRVAKNTLIKKALEANDEEKYAGLYESLKGPTALMFTSASNAPAKVLKEFRKSHEMPILKAAYIDTDIYVGDEQIETLAKLKSRDELIGDIIGLLQSPAKTLVAAFQAPGKNLLGILKTIEEKEEA